MKNTKQTAKAATSTPVDWTGHLLMVPSHDRLQSFLACMNYMNDADYWQNLSLVWQSSEITAPNFRTWKYLFGQFRSQFDKLMTEEEQAYLKALPERIKVYRGYNDGSWHRGLSWTLSEDVAKFFSHYSTGPRRAALFGAGDKPKPMIAEALVRKIHVIAYLDGRKEKEVVIDPGCPLENLTFRRVLKRSAPRKPSV